MLLNQAASLDQTNLYLLSYLLSNILRKISFLKFIFFYGHKMNGFRNASKDATADSRTSYSHVNGTVKWTDQDRPYGFVRCENLGRDAIIFRDTLIKAGIESLEDGQKVVVDIVSRLDPKKGTVLTVTRLKEPFVPLANRPKPPSRVIITEAFLKNFMPGAKDGGYGFFIINSPTQYPDCNGRTVFFHVEDPGFRKYFMHDGKVLLQPGDPVIAKIEINGPKGPRLLQVVPPDVGDAALRTNTGLDRPPLQKSPRP
jgi:cold shock protein